MREPVNKEHNTANLRDISAMMQDIEHFIFFGTLLGYEREKGIIEGDDDIDIYVESSERAKLIKLLRASAFVVKLDLARNATPHFLQVTRRRDGVKTFVDFYFYDNPIDTPYIVERWNFSGNWRSPQNAIRVPKDIVFPITTREFEDFQVKVPVDPAGCCDFLYGPTWKSPLKKGTQYKMVIEDNKPKLVAQPLD